MGMTPMISPDGSTGEIPTTRVGEAVKAGYKIGAKLTSPDGKTGAVPLERVHDAIKAGFSPYIPTEQQAAASPVIDTAAQALPENKLFQQHPANVLYRDIRSREDTNQITQRQKVAGEVSEDAQTTGNVLGVVGGAANSIPATLGALGGGYGGSKLGEYVGEKSGLKPYETIWASRIGGVLGAFAGGGAGGSEQAENVWSGLKNSFANKLYNADGELSKFGESLVHPTKMPENALRAIFPSPQDIPGGVAPSSPTSAEFYENKAADLVKRGKEQAAIDRTEGVKARAAARDASQYYSATGGQSTAPSDVSTLPPASSGGAQTSSASPMTSTGPAVQMNTPGAPPPGKSVIVSPDSAPAPIKGSFWSYSQSALKDAVMAGDREAAVIYRMRFNELPPGAKYLNDVSESIIKGLYKSSK